jgi:hypothetical protein
MAIIVEFFHIEKYRKEMLHTPKIGTLRRTLEGILSTMVKPVNAIINKRNVQIMEYKWWDEITMPDDFVCLTDAMLEGESLKEQEILKERQSLEIVDRDAILKLVSSVQRMPCAKATALKDSALASEVSDALQHLIGVR